MPEKDISLTPAEQTALAGVRINTSEGDLRSGVQKLARLIAEAVKSGDEVTYAHVFEAFGDQYDTISLENAYFKTSSMISRILSFKLFAILSLVGYYLSFSWFASKAASGAKWLLTRVASLVPGMAVPAAAGAAISTAGEGFTALLPPFLVNIFKGAFSASEGKTNTSFEPGGDEDELLRTAFSPGSKANWFKGSTGGAELGRIGEILLLDGTSVKDVPFYSDTVIYVTDPASPAGSPEPGPNKRKLVPEDGGFHDPHTDDFIQGEDLFLAESTDGSFQIPEYEADYLRDTARGTIVPGELGVQYARP